MARRLNESLKPLLLKDVQETGQLIGKGAFGSVKKVRLWGMVCAAKALHELSQGGGIEEEAVVTKFERECQMLSNLRHPYIVQFLGIYLEKATLTPLLVMEFLPTSLSACLKTHPRIPRYLQISMLHNVALALAYLHGHSPPIVHRDLTANNVLLTTNMLAKIADLGVARMLDVSRMRSQLTQAPGTAAYMPPEALAPNPQYTTKIDCFSFGNLLVHLVSQEWPLPAEPTRLVKGKLVPVSEPDRRQQYLDKIGKEHCLMPLAVQCLQNDPGLRPEAEEMSGILESLQTSNPVPATSHLDLLQVLESNRTQIETKGVQLAANKEQLQTISLQLQGRDDQIQSLQRQLAEMEHQIATSLKGLLLNSPSSNGPASPSTTSPHSSKNRTPTVLHPTQSAFTWKRDADMTVGMYGARGVVIDDKLYVGGGDCKDLEAERVVHEYDCNGLVRKWTALPPAPVGYFALAEVNKTLTLVGGFDVAKRVATNHLTVWDRGQQGWCTPFPAMPTSRQDCTAISHRQQLLVAGGSNFKKPLYNVEVLNFTSFQWQHLPPLPQPCVRMTSCVVGSQWYLLGGINFTDPSQGESGPQTNVFSLDLTKDVTKNKWTVLPNTPHYCATAVPFGRYLMAVGGVDTPASQAQSGAMYMYSAAAEKWLHVGSLPTPRSQTTAVVLAKSRLMLLGGQEKKERFGRTVEILQC